MRLVSWLCVIIGFGFVYKVEYVNTDCQQEEKYSEDKHKCVIIKNANSLHMIQS